MIYLRPLARADRADHGIAPAQARSMFPHRICEEIAPATSGTALTASAGYFRIRSEEHTSELQSLMRISYAVLCLKKKKQLTNTIIHTHMRTAKTKMTYY